MGMPFNHYVNLESRYPTPYMRGMGWLAHPTRHRILLWEMIIRCAGAGTRSRSACAPALCIGMGFPRFMN